MADGARGLAERLTAEIAQAVVENLDIDAIVQRIDVQSIASRVDPDDIATRLDVNDVVDRVDVQRLVDRIDVDELVARIDVDALAERIDVDRIVARIDLAAAIERVDVRRLAEQVDFGGEDGRVDPDTVLAMVDVQGVVDRIDLGPALRRAGLADIIADSVSRTALTQFRRQVVNIDILTQRVLAVVLRHDLEDWPAGPPKLVGGEVGVLGRIDDDGAEGRVTARLDGHYAGPFARLATTAADVVGALGSYTLLYNWVLSLLTSVFGVVETSDGGSAANGVSWIVGLVLYLGLWFLVPLVLTGRTPAMGLTGLRVVSRDGDPLPAGRTVLRTLLQGGSVLLSGFGYLTIFFDKQRGAVHDLLVGSVVVHDWGGDSNVSTPYTRFLESHA